LYEAGQEDEDNNILFKVADANKTAARRLKVKKKEY